jgi:hypothetical protein
MKRENNYKDKEMKPERFYPSFNLNLKVTDYC